MASTPANPTAQIFAIRIIRLSFVAIAAIFGIIAQIAVRWLHLRHEMALRIEHVRHVESTENWHAIYHPTSGRQPR
jgi:hypothetical protein